MVPLTAVPAALRRTVLDWRNLRAADLLFTHRSDAILAFVVLVGLALGVLVMRAMASRKAGRTQVALPAVLNWSGGSWLSLVRHGALILFLAGLPFFVIALADPYTALTHQDVSFPGRRIGLLIDASSSMMARFPAAQLNKKAPNEATFFTNVAAAEVFIRQRMAGKYHDLIGLVEFGDEAYVVTPFTTDYENIMLSIRLISSPREWGNFNDWGTTIIQGLNQATELFKAFDFVNAAGNAMVMFTDGRDEEKTLKGKSIDDVVAEMRKNKIPVFMVRTGFGLKEGQIPTDKLWRPIVEATGGRFYAADNEDAILQATAEIDKLSTGRIDVREYTAQRPRFDGYALIAIALWLAAGTMKLGFRTFRTFP